MPNNDIKIKELPLVAIIGRTNVGKSTLFNRIIEEGKAITSTMPGTTRDVIYGIPVWRGKNFSIVDTAGLDIEGKNELEKNILRQVERAKKEAEVIILILDLQTGIMPDDRRLLNGLVNQKKPFLVVANKADTKKIRNNLESKEWLNLPVKNILPVSAKNGAGIGDLLDAIYDSLKKLKIQLPEAKTEKTIKVSIVGKPNVGKSSLLNSLLQKEVAVVSSMPHTTREPQDIILEYGEKLITLVDTAGIRRKAKVEPGFEKMGVRKTITSIKRSDIVLLVLDAPEPFGVQDKRVAQLCFEARKGLIIIANKIDLIKGEDWHKNLIYRIHQFFPFLDWAPILYVSAKTGEKTKKIYDTILEVDENRKKELDARELELFVKGLSRQYKPLKAKGVRHPYIFGTKQTGSNPPRFTIFIREKTSVHEAYLKFLSKQIREEFGLLGTPIVMETQDLKI